jgi:hypothetical protein
VERRDAVTVGVEEGFTEIRKSALGTNGRAFALVVKINDITVGGERGNMGEICTDEGTRVEGSTRLIATAPLHSESQSASRDLNQEKAWSA